MNPLIEAWLTWYAAGDVSPSTIALRRSYIANFERAHPALLDVTGSDVAEWLNNPHWATESRRSARATIRSFYQWAARERLVDRDPTDGTRAIRPASRIPRPIPEDILAQALAAATSETRLMLLLGSYAGLRRSEIAQVNANHVTDLGLMVRGKGRKVRRVPIAKALQPELARLVEYGGWAFPSPRRRGEHVTHSYIADRLGEVLPAPWTAHSLRHRAATVLYRSCRDVAMVQQFLGHAKIETSMLYILVEQDALANAVAGIA